MKIAVLGTGMVGAAIASRLVECGHDVTMGARDAANEKAKAWVHSTKRNARAGTFNDAATAGEIVFNCTRGTGTLEALQQAGAAALKGKVLIDISNPLDFSRGMPPSLTVSNTDSLGEKIQRAFPDARVVKTLNTLTAALMVNPRLLPGEHVNFVSGNDAAAKATAKQILRQFGWKDSELVDLGPIQAARGTEAWLLLWVSLMGALGTPMFNLNLVAAPKA